MRPEALAGGTARTVGAAPSASPVGAGEPVNEPVIFGNGAETVLAAKRGLTEAVVPATGAGVTFARAGANPGRSRPGGSVLRPVAAAGRDAAVSTGRATTAGDSWLETVEETAPVGVEIRAVAPTCPGPVVRDALTAATGLFTCNDAPTVAVSACTEAVATGVEAFATTDDAVASTAAPPAGPAASTVAEAGVSLDESNVVSTEADGVETFALAPGLAVETLALADAGPRSAEIETPGFFGCDEPAAATCASTANPTSPTTTRKTSTRIVLQLIPTPTPRQHPSNE